MIPEWAPNLHPLVVHFPIALLSVAVVADLASLFKPDDVVLRNGVTWLYLAGTAWALGAYTTGLVGADELVLSSSATEIVGAVESHEYWAFRATWFFAFFASLRLALSFIFRPRRYVHVGAFLLAVMGLAMLGQTVERGAALVYEHGVGVRHTVR